METKQKQLKCEDCEFLCLKRNERSETKEGYTLYPWLDNQYWFCEKLKCELGNTFEPDYHGTIQKMPVKGCRELYGVIF